MDRFTVRAFQAEDRERLQVVRELAFKPIHDGFRKQLGDEIFTTVRGDAEQKQAEYLDAIMGGRERTELHVLLEGDTKALGVRLARVGTGLDNNHVAARKAYEAVGFNRSLSWTVLYQLI